MMSFYGLRPNDVNITCTNTLVYAVGTNWTAALFKWEKYVWTFGKKTLYEVCRQVIVILASFRLDTVPIVIAIMNGTIVELLG